MKILKKLLKKFIIWNEVRKIRKNNKIERISKKDKYIIEVKKIDINKLREIEPKKKSKSLKTKKSIPHLKKDCKEKKISKKSISNKKKINNNFIFYIPIAVFSLIFIFSISKVIIWSIEKIKVNKTMANINELIIVEEVLNNSEDEIVDEEKEDKKEDVKEESIYSSYKKTSLISVDFNKLKELNSATVGWIQVNGTDVNYPVVKALDNEFYLHHDFNDKYNSAGWIFMDYRNNANNFDKNTIIYGHNRMDDIMFGTLMNTLKKSWFNNKDNHYIKLSTPKENSVWQVFSVYYIKSTSDYIKTEFVNDSDYLSFIDLIKGRSIHSFNLDVSSNDKVLTLSSCYSKTERLVVHAKLINSQAR